MEGLRKHHFGSVFRIHRMANAQRMKDIEMMSKIASSRISGFEGEIYKRIIKPVFSMVICFM